MINSNVTTISLDGGETAVEFSQGYPYINITNEGKGTIYASLFPSIVSETDGVYTIDAGATEQIDMGISVNTIYILGEGKAYIRGEKNAFQKSFKQGARGGDSTGTTGSIDYNNLENKPDLSVYVKKEDCQFMTEEEVAEIIANAKGE